MLSIISAKQQRRSRLLASTFLVPIVFLSSSAVQAQQQAQNLPPITVTASRLNNGIVGASTSVITADDIAHSPAQSVPEIIAQTPGVQIWNIYGGVNGAGTTVDLRGFGAFASPNTLILINGRRLNDTDFAGVDLSTIPRDSIERIEITRGNSGAVLYGDNAVGGVINIVTKTGNFGPASSIRVEGGGGSFNTKFGAVSATMNQGAWSSSVFGNVFRSDGYRVNNSLDQANGIGDLRYTTPDFSAFLTLTGDNQHLGFPGPRTVDPSIGLNQLVTDRKGTNTPFDYGDKQGASATTGFTKTLWDGGELIVDGGVRNKKQQAGFFGNVPLDPFAFSYVDSTLTTWSITPRLNIKNPFFGLPSNILTGIDYYDATYHSDRPAFQGAPPVHVYDIAQQTLAAYWQQTVGILPTTDVSYGARIQRTSVNAHDTLDMSAPNYFGESQITPLDSSETNHALHVGIEHRFNDMFALFGRAASAFRTPNVDERVGSGPEFDINGNPLPRAFTLKTQTSHDVEGGIRVKAGRFELQSSIYDMELTNEIHFDPVNFVDYNLDPTRRYGSETNATYRVSDDVLLRGGLTYTRAIFREGPFTGNDVPLVSRWTTSGGITWNAWQKYLVVDATVRYWSSRHMDNDQPNTQPLIPANATVDLKLSGEYEHFFWAVSVNNLFNAFYYDYAIASSFTPDRFNAYPLPGRTYLVKAGMAF
jgi:iron complex outermembrane receptor protein